MNDSTRSWADIVSGERERRGAIPPSATITLLEADSILRQISEESKRVLERSDTGAAGELYGALVRLGNRYREQKIESDLLGFGVTDPKALAAHRAADPAFLRRQQADARAHETLERSAELIAQALAEGVVATSYVNELHNAITAVIDKPKRHGHDQPLWQERVVAATLPRGTLPDAPFLTSVEAKKVLQALTSDEQSALRKAEPLLGGVFDGLANIAGTSVLAQLDPMQELLTLMVEQGSIVGDQADGIRGQAARHRQKRGQEPEQGLAMLSNLREVMGYAQESFAKTENHQALELLARLHNALTDVLDKPAAKGR